MIMTVSEKYSLTIMTVVNIGFNDLASRLYNCGKPTRMLFIFGNLGPLWPKEIDRLFVPPGKASTLLTARLITG